MCRIFYLIWDQVCQWAGAHRDQLSWCTDFVLCFFTMCYLLTLFLPVVNPHTCLVLQVTSSPRTQSSFLICSELTTILQSGLTRTVSNQVLLPDCELERIPFTWLGTPQIKSLSLSSRALSGGRRRLHPCPDPFRRWGPALSGGVCRQNGALSVHCLLAERFPVRPSWERGLSARPERSC